MEPHDQRAGEEDERKEKAKKGETSWIWRRINQKGLHCLPSPRCPRRAAPRRAVAGAPFHLHQSALSHNLILSESANERAAKQPSKRVETLLNTEAFYRGWISQTVEEGGRWDSPPDSPISRRRRNIASEREISSLGRRAACARGRESKHTSKQRKGVRNGWNRNDSRKHTVQREEMKAIQVLEGKRERRSEILLTEQPFRGRERKG